MSGWIKLHKKIESWEWYKHPNTKALFLHLLIKANYEDKTWRGCLVKRGQVPIGRKALSVQLGMSEQNIRTSLANLKSTNDITIKPTNKFSLITIIQYEYYQVKDAEVANTLTTKLTTPKEEKNIYMCISDFEEFWKEYPNKKNKKKARDKFLNLKKSLLPEIILSLKKQKVAESWTKDQGRFIPHPTTWLNGERWSD